MRSKLTRNGREMGRQRHAVDAPIPDNASSGFVAVFAETKSSKPRFVGLVLWRGWLPAGPGTADDIFVFLFLFTWLEPGSLSHIAVRNDLWVVYVEFVLMGGVC